MVLWVFDKCRRCTSSCKKQCTPGPKNTPAPPPEKLALQLVQQQQQGTKASAKAVHRIYIVVLSWLLSSTFMLAFTGIQYFNIVLPGSRDLYIANSVGQAIALGWEEFLELHMGDVLNTLNYGIQTAIYRIPTEFENLESILAPLMVARPGIFSVEMAFTGDWPKMTEYATAMKRVGKKNTVIMQSEIYPECLNIGVLGCTKNLTVIGSKWHAKMRDIPIKDFVRKTSISPRFENGIPVPISMPEECLKRPSDEVDEKSVKDTKSYWHRRYDEAEMYRNYLTVWANCSQREEVSWLDFVRSGYNWSSFGILDVAGLNGVNGTVYHEAETSSTTTSTPIVLIMLDDNGTNTTAVGDGGTSGTATTTPSSMKPVEPLIDFSSDIKAVLPKNADGSDVCLDPFQVYTYPRPFYSSIDGSRLRVKAETEYFQKERFSKEIYGEWQDPVIAMHKDLGKPFEMPLVNFLFKILLPEKPPAVGAADEAKVLVAQEKIFSVDNMVGRLQIDTTQFHKYLAPAETFKNMENFEALIVHVATGEIVAAPTLQQQISGKRENSQASYGEVMDWHNIHKGDNNNGDGSSKRELQRGEKPWDLEGPRTLKTLAAQTNFGGLDVGQLTVSPGSVKHVNDFTIIGLKPDPISSKIIRPPLVSPFVLVIYANSDALIDIWVFVTQWMKILMGLFPFAASLILTILYALRESAVKKKMHLRETRLEHVKREYGFVQEVGADGD